MISKRQPTGDRSDTGADANQATQPTAAEYRRANSLVTDDELQRAADEPGGCSTEELLQELRGM